MNDRQSREAGLDGLLHRNAGFDRDYALRPFWGKPNSGGKKRGGGNVRQIWPQRATTLTSINPDDDQCLM